ncbi:uncharacterized protein G2W53_007617 [Senna tora]|uniref:Uncharacterized protein n=1 Tax=Senna tora TaxID=362788 RepID=A0A834X736_9FABA|nr:uncharacterized protein G2W53_007617 [Senna tora]
MGLAIAWKERHVMSKHILNKKSQLNIKRIQEVQVIRDVAQVRQIDRFAFGFNAGPGLVIARKEYEVMLKYILKQKSRLKLKRIEEVPVKHVVAQLRQTDRFALNLGIRLDLMLKGVS